MADNNSTYLFYDKAVDDNHKFGNKLTVGITIEGLFSSNYNYVEGPQAIKEINKCFPDENYSMCDNLDFSLYNIYLFSYNETGAQIRIIVVEINNKKIKELVELVIKHSGKDIDVKWLTDVPSGDKKRLMSMNKMNKYGYKSFTSLEEGVKKTTEWFLNNKDILDKRYNPFVNH